MGRLSKLMLSVILCFGLGSLGALVTTPSIPTWYAYLTKPFFSPPNWIFGPVWSILYILMGISLYLIWQKGPKKKNVRAALRMFLLQFVLNLLWSPVFFGFKQLLLSFIVIVFLWITVFYTITSFSKLDRIASYLLYPYLAWISFASILNFSVWLLNR